MKTVLSYLLAVGGVGAMLFSLAAVAGRFRYLVARPMIIHLLRTNPHQAEAMCRNDKGTFLEAIAAAMKTAAMMKSRDPAILAQASHPAYDAACMQIGMYWKTILKRVKIAAGLAVGAPALAISVHASCWLQILLGLVALGGCGWVLLYKLDVDRSVVLARAEVLPDVERAFADGRYQFPP